MVTQRKPHRKRDVLQPQPEPQLDSHVNQYGRQPVDRDAARLLFAQGREKALETISFLDALGYGFKVPINNASPYIRQVTALLDPESRGNYISWDLYKRVVDAEVDAAYINIFEFERHRSADDQANHELLQRIFAGVGPEQPGLTGLPDRQIPDNPFEALERINGGMSFDRILGMLVSGAKRMARKFANLPVLPEQSQTLIASVDGGRTPVGDVFDKYLIDEPEQSAFLPLTHYRDAKEAMRTASSGIRMLDIANTSATVIGNCLGIPTIEERDFPPWLQDILAGLAAGNILLDLSPDRVKELIRDLHDSLIIDLEIEMNREVRHLTMLDALAMKANELAGFLPYALQVATGRIPCIGREIAWNAMEVLRREAMLGNERANNAVKGITRFATKANAINAILASGALPTVSLGLRATGPDVNRSLELINSLTAAIGCTHTEKLASIRRTMDSISQMLTQGLSSTLANITFGGIPLPAAAMPVLPQISLERDRGMVQDLNQLLGMIGIPGSGICGRTAQMQRRDPPPPDIHPDRAYQETLRNMQ